MARPRESRPALTQQAIRDAEPGETRRYIWDGQVHGLGVLVQPGGAKSFIIQRGAAGTTVRRSLSSFPEMSLVEARRLAEEPLAVIRAGRNPNAERKAKREAEAKERRERISCRELWARYEIEVMAARNRPTTAAQKKRMWATKIEPVIGAVAVRDVDGDHVRRIVHGPMKVEDGRVVSGKGEAGNLYRLLKHMMRTAIRWKLRPAGADPTVEVDQPRVERRQRLLTDREMSALFGAVAEAEAGDLSASVAGAVRFILLTGWRASEVLTLRREHVDHERREARLPDTKTGHSVRPLSAEALALLDGLPRVVGSPWYFPAASGGRTHLSISALSSAMRRLSKRAGIRHVSPHVIRHRVVTDVASLAPNLRVGMALSGHRSTAAYLGYVHSERERAAEVADAVGARLGALATAIPAPVVAGLPRPTRKRAGR